MVDTETLTRRMCAHLERAGATMLDEGERGADVHLSLPHARGPVFVCVAGRERLYEQQLRTRLCDVAAAAGEERVVLAVPPLAEIGWERVYGLVLAVTCATDRPLDVWVVRPEQIAEVMGTRPW